MFIVSNVIVLDIQSVYSVINHERKVKLERARGIELRVKGKTRRSERSGRKSKTVALYAKKKREYVLGLLSLSARVNCAKCLVRDRLRRTGYM